MPDRSRKQQDFLVSFGRRRGRKLKSQARGYVEDILPSLRIALPEGAPDAVLDPHSLMPGARECWLEIGFGGGEHLWGQAARHPDVLCIGCEPYLNGMAHLLAKAAAEGAHNVRVFPDDARLLLRHFPNKCLDRVFVLFPDPWPKARHHKRRIVNSAFLDMLQRVMKKNALLTIASDHEDYITWILEHVTAHPGFAWEARSAADWKQPPADWVSTRYEQKALAQGISPVYLRFHRI